MGQSARVKARSPLWRCEWRKRKGKAPLLCCGERTKLSPGGDSTRDLGGKVYTGKFRIFSEQKWWCHCGYLRSLDFPCTTNPHPSTEFHAPTSEPQRSSAPICIRVSLLTAGLEERSATTRLLVSTLGKCLHQGVFCHRIQSIRCTCASCVEGPKPPISRFHWGGSGRITCNPGRGREITRARLRRRYNIQQGARGGPRSGSHDKVPGQEAITRCLVRKP